MGFNLLLTLFTSLTLMPEFNSEGDLDKWLGKIGMDLGVFYKSPGSVGGGET